MAKRKVTKKPMIEGPRNPDPDVRSIEEINFYKHRAAVSYVRYMLACDRHGRGTGPALVKIFGLSYREIDKVMCEVVFGDMRVGTSPYQRWKMKPALTSAVTKPAAVRAFFVDVDEATGKVLAEVSELGLATELDGPDRGAAIMAVEHIVSAHTKAEDGLLDVRKADAVWEAVLAGLGVEMGQSQGKTLN